MTRCALYRHFDAAGTLLYVGVTRDHNSRFRAHDKASAWFGAVATTTMDWHLSRESALAAEAEAIRKETPIHNTHHNTARKYQVTADVLTMHPDLLAEIEAFCLTSGMTISAFGQGALRDPCFVRDLRGGRELRSKTVGIVRDYIAAARSAA